MAIKYFLLAFAVIISLKALVEARHLNERNFLELPNLHNTLQKTAIKINNSERLSFKAIAKCLETYNEIVIPVHDNGKEEMGKCTTNKDLDKIVAELLDSENQLIKLWIDFFVEFENCDGNDVCRDWARNILTNGMLQWESDYSELLVKAVNIVKTLPSENVRCLQVAGEDMLNALVPILGDTTQCIGEAIYN